MTKDEFLQNLNIMSNAEERLFEYFGYRHDWRIFPVVEDLESYWRIDEHGGTLLTSNNEASLDDNDASLDDNDADDFCRAEIYCHLEQHVWRGADYTMALVDTHTDGNIYLVILSNTLEHPKRTP